MVFVTGCANMIPPTGGPRDSLPPVLVSTLPKDSTTNFTGNRITINFDEYIELQNVFENVLVSPTPNNTPVINYNFRTVSIRIKDTLEPNTTYSINFGNALRDINEGNVLKDFTYLFSTGTTIDQNTISGKVIQAETGNIDSTLIVVLQKNLNDSAVVKEKPRYITRLDGEGNFQFKNLAAGTFAIYAIPNDFSKKYEDTTKPFAFADSAINTTNNSQVTLYAYSLPKKDTTPKTGRQEVEERGDKDKKTAPRLSYKTNIELSRLDLLNNLEITFNRKITFFDSSKVKLTDTNYVRLPNYTFIADTANNRFTIKHNWLPGSYFNLVVDTTAFSDSTGLRLAKADTISFATKRTEDYGNVRLRFTNLDLTTNPVLQVVQNAKVIESIPLTQREWSRKLYQPGEYDLRLLLDENKNGIWDPGKFFGEHRQPEIVVPINTKLSVRANWDNEKEIKLQE
jgi:hypothetical protein